MPTEIIEGDCRAVLGLLPSGSANCCITSPPYFGLRDYDSDDQIGLEKTPDEYVAEIVAVFREVRRVLRDDGTLWLNLGDSYAGSWGAQSRGNETPGTLQGSSILSARQIKAHPKRTQTGSVKDTPGLKPKDLIGIPWMVAFALRADGWFLRQDNIWHKPNPMPESVKDRCTKAHEYLFMLSKSASYYFDSDEMQEEATSMPPGNKKHRGADAYAAGDEKHRTKTGLASYAERERKARTATPRHAGFPSSDQSGLDDVPRGKRNKRSVWTVPTRPFKEAHFATYPPDLIDPCVRAACPLGGTVLDPFFGAGTTGLVAAKHGRNCIGIETNPNSAMIARVRLGLRQSVFA